MKPSNSPKGRFSLSDAEQYSENGIRERVPMLRRLKNVSSAGDILELGLLALLGTLMLGTLVFAVPYIAIREALSAGRPGTAALIGAALIIAVLGIVVDLRMRRRSWISKSVGVLWFGCILYVFIRLF